MLTHWSSRQISDTTDTERVRTFMATSRHLRKRVFPVIEIYNFVWPLECYQFALGSGFSKLFSSTLSCALSLPVEQDQHLFLDCDYTAQLWWELLPT
uniref:AlNc14C736G12466 protein n=1 Tax=Albugo laibachii Nc14 TaxID=890382 RepID=F0X1Y9_9STRA|nr:AlNc14C736G12466 [Albugo laibachii Nc14]|eukprot:CCA27848.1 AlNc14C736G12466 [Albugo laibachii Nc14]